MTDETNYAVPYVHVSSRPFVHMSYDRFFKKYVSWNNIIIIKLQQYNYHKKICQLQQYNYHWTTINASKDGPKCVQVYLSLYVG